MEKHDLDFFVIGLASDFVVETADMLLAISSVYKRFGQTHFLDDELEASSKRDHLLLAVKCILRNAQSVIDKIETAKNAESKNKKE